MELELKTVIVLAVLYLIGGAYLVGWRNSIDLGEGECNHEKATRPKLQKVA